MARSGVTDFVHALHDGVEGGVVAYSGVGAVEVVVDGSGKAYDGEVVFVGEYARAGKGAVAAYHHQSVNLVAAQIVVGKLASFLSLELGAAGCLEYGSAHLYDVRYVLSLEFHYFVGYQAFVTAINAFDFESAENGRAGHGTDGSIHAGGVASGGEDADAFDF